MGFWGDILKSVNPFAKEDLSSPQAREKKAWKVAGSMVWLDYIMPMEKRELDLAAMTARSKVRTDKNNANSWNKKLFWVSKFQRSYDLEIKRAYRDKTAAPDIRDRAKWLYANERGQLMQQRPRRHFDPFHYGVGDLR